MILCLSGDGPLRAALARWFQEHGEDVRLVEELEAQPALQERCAVWLPRGRSVTMTSVLDAAESVARATLDDSLHGATLDGPSETLDCADVFRHAAARTRRAAVHAVPPGVEAVVRRVGRFFRVPQPAIVDLHGRLAASSASAA